MAEKVSSTEKMNLTLEHILDNDLESFEKDDHLMQRTFGMEMSALELQTFAESIKETQEDGTTTMLLHSINGFSNRLLDIENYSFNEFKTDYKNLLNQLKKLRGLSFENKARIETLIKLKLPAFTNSQWRKIQEKMSADMRAAKEVAESREKANQKLQTLTISQKKFLNSDINFNISSLVHLAENGPKTEEGKLETFKILLRDKVFEYVEKWQTKNRAPLQKAWNEIQMKKEKKGLEKAFTVDDNGETVSLLKFTSTGGIGQLADWGTGLLGDLVSNSAGRSFSLIEQDPILSKFFLDDKSKEILRNSLKPWRNDVLNQADLEKAVEMGIEKMFSQNKNGEPLTLQDIKKSYFDMGSRESIAQKATTGTQEAISLAKFLKEKHETVTRSYRKKEGEKGESWQEKYDTYLRKTGRAALDFPQWMEQNLRDGKISQLSYLWNKIVDTFSGFLEQLNIDWLDGDKTGAQKNELAEFYAQASGEIKPPKEEEPDDSEEKEEKRLSSIINYPLFVDNFKKQKSVYVHVDGETVDLKKPNTKINVIGDFNFTHINSLISKYPQAKKLFSPNKSKSLNLEDIDFMARNNGSDMDTGVNVRFEEADSIEFSYDSNLNMAIGSAGAIGAGTLAAVLLPVSTTVAVASIGGLAAGSTYFKTVRDMEKFLESGNLKIRYDELSRDKLSATITFFKRASGWKLESMDISDLVAKKDRKYFESPLLVKDLSENMFIFKTEPPRLEMCTALRNVTNFMDKTNYAGKITQKQLLALDKYFSDGIDDYDDLSIEEVKDVDWRSFVYKDVHLVSGGTEKPSIAKNFIQVNGGGGGFRDDNFENIEAFLEFVEKKYT